MAASSAVVSLMQVRGIEKAIRDGFATIPEIAGIEISHENGEMIVRIAANDPPKELRYRIYDKQISIIKAFPELDLDFSLIPRD